jgi:hypothetical protein
LSPSRIPDLTGTPPTPFVPLPPLPTLPPPSPPAPTSRPLHSRTTDLTCIPPRPPSYPDSSSPIPIPMPIPMSTPLLSSARSTSPGARHPPTRPLSPDLPPRDALYLFANFSSYMRSPDEGAEGITDSGDFQDTIRLLDYARVSGARGDLGLHEVWLAICARSAGWVWVWVWSGSWSWPWSSRSAGRTLPQAKGPATPTCNASTPHPAQASP